MLYGGGNQSSLHTRQWLTHTGASLEEGGDGMTDGGGGPGHVVWVQPWKTNTIDWYGDVDQVTHTLCLKHSPSPKSSLWLTAVGVLTQKDIMMGGGGVLDMGAVMNG